MAIAVATFRSSGQQTQHVVPGTYSRIDVVSGASGFVSTGNVVLIGSARGGEPQVLQTFSNQSRALNALKGGPLHDAIRHGFNPGPGFRPQRLHAVRINNATKSSYDLTSTSNLITVSSRDWGISQNQIQVMVTAGVGAAYGGSKFTFKLASTEETFDNLERGLFSIESAITNREMEITATTIEFTDATAATDNYTVTLADYSTVESLVSYLNSRGNVATVLDGNENTPLFTDEEVPSSIIDIAAAATIDSAVNVTANTQEVIDRLTAESGLVTAALATGASRLPGLDAIAAFQYFSGATEGDYTSAQLDIVLTYLESQNVQVIVTPDPDASSGVSIAGIHEKIKNHCERLSATAGRRERQFIVGGSRGATRTEAKAAAKTLNSFHGMYVFNGFRERDSNGVLKNWSAAYHACRLGGLVATLATNEPLTAKVLTGSQLENALSEDDLTDLIRNGVAPVAYNDDGVPNLARQVNTYQAPNKIYNEFSAIREAFFASRDLRNYLNRRMTGRPGSAVTAGQVEGWTRTRLQEFSDEGIFTGNAENPAFSNISVDINGDVYQIDYDANLTMPVNFGFVTSHFSEFVSRAVA